MTHNELITELFWGLNEENYTYKDRALRAVVELHEPFGPLCYACTCNEDEHIVAWPCQTIRAIQGRLT
jgi:hypothetical protein